MQSVAASKMADCCRPVLQLIVCRLQLTVIQGVAVLSPMKMQLHVQTVLAHAQRACRC